jgi:hypothetical protein
MRKTRAVLVFAAICVLSLFAQACDTGAPELPVAPGAPGAPPEPSGPRVNLSGTVVERVSNRPVQGLRVTVYPKPWNSVPRWPPGGEFDSTPSDALGRYSISGVPAASYYVSAWDPAGQHLSQCATTVVLSSDANQDLTVTSLPNLAAGTLRPPPASPGARTISGTVFEIVDAVRQPVDGAWVGLAIDLSGDVTGAVTLSVAGGRYLLCGLPQDRLTLFVVKDGYSRNGIWTVVEAGTDATVDFELKR